MDATADADDWEVVDLAGCAPGLSLGVAGYRQRGGRGLDRRVIPHGRVTMVLELSGSPIELGPEPARRGSAHFVAGLTTAPLLVRADVVDCVEIKMSPVSAFACLGVDVRSLTDQSPDIEQLWGASGRVLHERLSETNSWTERATLVASALRRRQERGRRVDPEVAMAWECIVESGGAVQVNELVRRSGWSRTRLWSRFSTQIGLSPKRAARLVRFERASSRLAAGAGPARVAAECGYVDQSHLHRDVVSFARCTPSRLAAELGAQI